MSLLRDTTDPAVFDLRPSGPGSVLDVGCGSKKHPGAVGIDRSADTDADVETFLAFRFPAMNIQAEFEVVK